MNVRQLLPLQVTCEELGHPQPATPMQTDNNTASGIINGTFNQARSKAIGTRYYWLMDRAQQKQFRIYWERGIKNLANYSSKHHLGAHHKQVRPIFLHTKESPNSLQGCIKLLDIRTSKLRDLIRLAGVHKQAATA